MCKFFWIFIFQLLAKMSENIFKRRVQSLIYKKVKMTRDVEDNEKAQCFTMIQLYFATTIMAVLLGVNFWLLIEPSIILTTGLYRYRAATCSTTVAVASENMDELSLIGEVEVTQRLNECKNTRINFEELFFENCRTHAQVTILWAIPVTQFLVTLCSFFLLLNKVKYKKKLFFSNNNFKTDTKKNMRSAYPKCTIAAHLACTIWYIILFVRLIVFHLDDFNWPLETQKPLICEPNKYLGFCLSFICLALSKFNFERTCLSYS